MHHEWDSARAAANRVDQRFEYAEERSQVIGMARRCAICRNGSTWRRHGAHYFGAEGNAT
jgi:hypothetical protein